MNNIELIECINTFQGEGPDVGQRMLLCRFKYCNLVEEKRPCNFCDTLVKMRVQEEMSFSLDKLQEIINKNNSGIMITGGEPTYGKNLQCTLDILNKLNYKVANIETNGYNIKDLIKYSDGFKNIKFIISPKIFNENDFKLFNDENLLGNILQDMRVYFKIVAPDLYSEQIISKLNDYNYNDKTFLMPKGVSDEELEKSYPYVLDLAEKYSMNITTRLHLNYNII